MSDELLKPVVGEVYRSKKNPTRYAQVTNVDNDKVYFFFWNTNDRDYHYSQTIHSRSLETWHNADYGWGHQTIVTGDPEVLMACLDCHTFCGQSCQSKL